MIGFHRARVRGSVGLVCAALLVATLAACGGTDNKAVTKSTATGSTVKIGVVASLSGQPLPALAGPAALKAWATTVNGKGGLQGHPVESRTTATTLRRASPPSKSSSRRTASSRSPRGAAST